MCCGQEYAALGDQVQLGVLGVIEGKLVGRVYVLIWDSCPLRGMSFRKAAYVVC